MAKGLGLLGNFNGKVGNTVGYAHKTSTNKQTQGVRVHQPIVKNPKTYGQAEMRLKLAPINATYKLLKPIIDRGQEGRTYGNKSRLKWISNALKQFEGPWSYPISKMFNPAIVPISNGTIQVRFDVTGGKQHLRLEVPSLYIPADTTLGKLSQRIMIAYPNVLNGDQLTFVAVLNSGGYVYFIYDSFIVDSSSNEPIPEFITINNNYCSYKLSSSIQQAYTVILSRKSLSGAHLRNQSFLVPGAGYDISLLTDDAKLAAIQAYMAADGSSDWEEDTQQ